MESHTVWNRRISKAATELGFNEGYKILYVPWSTIGASDTIFLSLNPGRAPYDAALSTLSDERGNSYEVEASTTRSPLTKQFLALAEKLSLKPLEILTGAVVPFRSDRWHDCTREQRLSALALGREFWRQAFELRRPRLVIACGMEAARMAANLLDAEIDVSLPSGWGRTKIRRYCASDGAFVIHLPHLSTFKLFSRPECDGPVTAIINSVYSMNY
jgi:hypothetical protein